MEVTTQMLKDAHEIADHYGARNQMSIAQEECAELIQAISKLFRYFEWSPSGHYFKAKEGDGNSLFVNLIEEMADVQLMLIQLEHLVNAEPLMSAIIEMKLERRKKLIAEEAKKE